MCWAIPASNENGLLVVTQYVCEQDRYSDNEKLWFWGFSMFMWLGLCSRSVCTSCECAVWRAEAANTIAQEKQSMSWDRSGIDNAVDNMAIQLSAPALILQSWLMCLHSLILRYPDVTDWRDTNSWWNACLQWKWLSWKKLSFALCYYGTLITNNNVYSWVLKLSGFAFLFYFFNYIKNTIFE